MYQSIFYENQSGIARITLNRPAVYHALDPHMLSELLEAFQKARNDESVRVVVFTGSGEKAFCSGADLKEAIESGRSAGNTLRDFYDPLIRVIRDIPKTVICRLNGLAVGAGCSLVLACDIVIASEEAYLSLLFVQIGLMPDAGATYFLPRLVGAAKAFELASTGRKVFAPEAAQIGLISKSVPAADLDKEVDVLTSYYREAPTQAIGTMKQILNASFGSDLTQMQDLERAGQEKLFQSADAKEGISAFLEKRKPRFTGR